MAVVLPVVHMNGTTADELIDNLRAVCDGLRATEEALAKAAPNQRDYYPAGLGLWNAALLQHSRRREAIETMLREINEEMEGILAQE